MLSVLLRYTDSDCPFGIFKLFLWDMLTLGNTTLILRDYVLHVLAISVFCSILSSLSLFTWVLCVHFIKTNVLARINTNLDI